MITSETALIDTNVLLYAYDESSPYHNESLQLVERGRKGELPLCLTPQVLSEFYSLITNPRRTSNFYTAEEALIEIEKFYYSRNIPVIYFTAAAKDHLLILLRRYQVTRQNIFDLQLVAAMLANNVTRVYTFDRNDFLKFSEIEVLSP